MSKLNLEEVLEEYAIATAPTGNDLKILQLFTAKYPQYADELADFAAARAVAKYAPREEVSAAEEKRFQEAGLKNLRAVLGSLNPTPSVSPNTLLSLVEAARAKGLNRSGFAKAVGLSISLVMYLEKRRIDFVTIPKKILAKIADVLETGEELISAYLNQPPDYAVNTSFKTETRAKEVSPKSFADAVREDQQLSAEEKRRLMDLS